jgi:peptide/nickel transport system ATP-binding protein
VTGTGPAELLRIEDLRVSFATADGPLVAVGGLSLELGQDEVLAVVGESGCGKTLTGLSVLGIEPAAAQVSGQVWFRGEDLRTAPPQRLRKIRGAQIAMIFQEPMTSLNPSLTVGFQVAEVVRRHQGLDRGAARRRAAELFEMVQLPSPREQLRAYPHQMSGGMRQRVMIAMAIACDPAVLIADEPTTALDPTIQAQILDLLRDLRKALRMSMLLITHNLGVVAGLADRVLVMYAGHAVEQGPTADVLRGPAHPYTTGLLAAVPRAGTSRDALRLVPIAGSVPLLRGEPTSCVFSPRCPYARAECEAGMPALRPAPRAGTRPYGRTAADGTRLPPGIPAAHEAACVLDLPVAAP